MSGDAEAQGAVSTADGPSDEARITINEVQSKVMTSIGTAPQELPEADEFGLPSRKPRRRSVEEDESNEANEDKFEEAQESNEAVPKMKEAVVEDQKGTEACPEPTSTAKSKGKEPVKDVDPAVDNDQPAAQVDGQDPNAAKDTKSPVSGAKPKEIPNGVRIASAGRSAPGGGVSEWSHQQLAPHEDEEEVKQDDGEWQEMPAVATHTIYDDWGKVLAREEAEIDDDKVAYGTLGGAGKGYTRVQVDDDAQSATSLDDNTAYLFKDGGAPANHTLDEDDEGRDLVSQMQATKELLTEGQRIAYVGVVRLSLAQMVTELEHFERTKGAKKFVDLAAEATKMWGQKMMVRLYKHMEIDSAEQVMVEQLGEHGVQPGDLTPALMQNARVKNPKAEAESVSQRPSVSESVHSTSSIEKRLSGAHSSAPSTPGPSEEPPPPPYQEKAGVGEDTTVKDPSELPDSKSIDLDIRWTVLCDLFLVLIADSTYDARSRTLLEHVGEALSVPWLEMCRFEKRVTDALEMQEEAAQENWNEDEHMAERKKSARRKRLVVMGLCTVGGGLVIGLSAGLLAPVIGAGLAAGFTTIGVAGTSSFLAGAGGAAIIASTGIVTGGTIAVRASNRRMGSVKTFEYRPLHNNKRVNLIVTVSGWMTGKVDDVRLPFSTVDPIMGDIYSVHWEPEMLQSTGDTINILATEALTQTIQQILGSTILTALMAGLSLPIVLTKLAYLIDNPWTVSLTRADSAGLILADSLIDRNLGTRPITLVGFSLGSRVIFSCLKELANRGALGLIQNVYLFGTPIVANRDDYIKARTVVSGRFVNGYATNDWILGYLFRLTSGGIARIAGLSEVQVPGIENFNCTEIVPGHMAYRGMMPLLLHEVGWIVESYEFTEIEDPDPDNHEKRQRELINEIEEARKALDEKPEKKGFKALFSRKKKAPEKKPWEMYDERSRAEPEGKSGDKADADVLFDTDAIRREAAQLAASNGVLDLDRFRVRELESTLPPMKLSLEDSAASTNGLASNNPYANLRQTQSYDGSAAVRTQAVSSNNSLPNGDSGRSSPFKGSQEATASSGRTSPSKPSHPDDPQQPSFHQPSEQEEEISLSFDPPDNPQTPSSRTLSPHPPAQPHISREPSPLNETRALPRPRYGVSDRPPLPKSASSPLHVPTHVMSLEHNAWADDFDHEELGREREVEMSFE